MRASREQFFDGEMFRRLTRDDLDARIQALGETRHTTETQVVIYCHTSSVSISLEDFDHAGGHAVSISIARLNGNSEGAERAICKNGVEAQSFEEVIVLASCTQVLFHPLLAVLLGDVLDLKIGDDCQF